MTAFPVRERDSWATSRSPEPAAATGGREAFSAALADTAVSALWRASWAALQAVYPDLSARLVQLEHGRPTRHRALARLEASAARRGARCLRGTASPAELLMKLLTWEAAVVAELEKS